MNLMVLFILNLIGMMVVILLPTSLHRLYKMIGLITANLLLLLSLFLWINFNKQTLNFQFICSTPWFNEFYINLDFGVDGISLFFVLLTTFIFPFVILASWEMKKVSY